jgi:carbonic anhydrase/acetyltransferase-like protein (isoleucine patch superfamily)
MKYEMTTETMVMPNGETLSRIRALKDFDSVKAGEYGGFICHELNLSQYDNCWIGKRAFVYENAVVYGDAKIYDYASVYGSARICERAQISGAAAVFGKALVLGEAQIRGKAQIYDRAQVLGTSEIRGSVHVFERAEVLGGTICGEARISGEAVVTDDAYIIDNAVASGDAYVNGQMRLYGNASVKSRNDMIYFCGVGSSHARLYAYRTADGGVSVLRGCFQGTLVEFKKAVQKKHGNTPCGLEYQIIIKLLRQRFLKRTLAERFKRLLGKD